MEANQQFREEVLQAVTGLSDEQLNKQVEPGRWSIMQVLEHLYLIEKSITRMISYQLENGETKQAAGMPVELTVDRSRKLTAPSFSEPTSEFITLEDMKQKLAKSREIFNQVVNDADPAVLEQRAYPHPAFGELSLKQWIPFIGLHEKRHLAQIEELKGKLG